MVVAPVTMKSLHSVMGGESGDGGGSSVAVAPRVLIEHAPSTQASTDVVEYHADGKSEVSASEMKEACAGDGVPADCPGAHVGALTADPRRTVNYTALIVRQMAQRTVTSWQHEADRASARQQILSALEQSCQAQVELAENFTALSDWPQSFIGYPVVHTPLPARVTPLSCKLTCSVVPCWSRAGVCLRRSAMMLATASRTILKPPTVKTTQTPPKMTKTRAGAPLSWPMATSAPSPCQTPVGT